MQDHAISSGPGPIEDNLKLRLERRLGKRYAILSMLGQGSAGTVFEVKNLHLDRREALKVLSEAQPPSFSHRFAHEAKVSAALDHPCIVKIHEFECEDGFFWYSMQYIEGPSLAQLMAVRGRLDQTSMARLAIPLLDALHHSHGHGVVHRDIKPANILINEEGRPFLTDFGIAKTAESMVKTRTGMMLGTPAYVSPEQALGHAVDPRSDIYSLGVTLYEMLSKRLPFTAENALQTVVMRCREDPEPLLDHCDTVNPALAAIIMRALARDREDRWASAALMREAMIEACDASGIEWNQPLADIPDREAVRAALTLDDAELLGTLASSRMASLDDRVPGSWLRRLRWPGIAAAALLAALLGFGLRSRAQRKEAPAPLPMQAAPAPRPVVPPPEPPALPSPRPRPAPQPKGTPEALPRRAVTPPMLEEASQPDPGQALGCAGLTVNLSLQVGEDGRVRSCRVLSKVSPECARAAREAGMRHRFRPALDAQGRPVDSTAAIAILFPEAP